MTGIEAISPELITRVQSAFEKIGCAQLSDVCNELENTEPRGAPLPPRITSRGARARMCGPAFPVNTTNDMLPGLEALCRAPSGYVVLINNLARESEALAGDIYVTDAKAGGLAGLVIHGALRDVAQIRELDFPVFASEINFVSARTAITAASAAPEVVTIGSVSVNPNDWIFGDEDGLIVIKNRYLRAVLAAAVLLNNRECELRSRITEATRLNGLCGILDFIEGRGELKFAV